MTRKEAKNLLYDKHGEDDKLIDQIYNDHEAQIKAKDEEIEMLQRRLYHAYGYIKDRYEPKEQ